MSCLECPPERIHRKAACMAPHVRYSQPLLLFKAGQGDCCKSSLSSHCLSVHLSHFMRLRVIFRGDANFESRLWDSGTQPHSLLGPNHSDCTGLCSIPSLLCFDSYNRASMSILHTADAGKEHQQPPAAAQLYHQIRLGASWRCAALQVTDSSSGAGAELAERATSSRSQLDGDKGDEADVADDANAKVIAKGLPDLDSIPDAHVRDVIRLYCTERNARSAQTQRMIFSFNKNTSPS